MWVYNLIMLQLEGFYIRVDDLLDEDKWGNVWEVTEHYYD